MPPFNVSKYFDNANFSDITIKLEDREIKCHKVFLCENSKYFTKACGPDSPFLERDQKVIELKEDDPDAMTAMLKFIYDDQVELGRNDDWGFQLELSKVADKYDLEELSSSSFDRFESVVKELRDTTKIRDAINTIRDKGIQDEHFDIADELEYEHLSALLKDKEYRDSLDVETMLTHMDRLNFKGDLAEFGVWKCRQCKKSVALPWSKEKPKVEACGRYNGPCELLGGAQCWMSRADAEAFNKIS